MIFSDRSIREAIANGRIRLDPYDPSLVQPSSVDVRCDDRFLVFENHRYPQIDPKAVQADLTTEIKVTEADPFILHPGEFVLGATLESIGLGDVGQLEGHLPLKSRVYEAGSRVNEQAEPAQRGLSFESSDDIVANLPITIYPGMRIGQISFYQMTTAAEHPYGSAGLGSKYQGQSGPTPSRMHEDFEED